MTTPDTGPVIPPTDRPSVWTDPLVLEEAAVIFRRALARLEAAKREAS